MCCEYHAVEEVQWLKGEGLLTPQPYVFTLTARPGALRPKPQTGSFAETSIRLLPCGSVGHSLRFAAVLQVPDNLVVAKMPLPLEPHINKEINEHYTRLQIFKVPRPCSFRQASAALFCQHGIDDFLKFGKRLGAYQFLAVDKKGRRSPHRGTAACFHVLIDRSLKTVTVQVGIKLLHVQL